MDLDSSNSSSYNNGFAAFSSVAQQQQQQQQQQFVPQQQQQLQQQQQHFQQQQQQQQPLFGLIAATAPVRTDFAPVEGYNGTKFALSVTTAEPGGFPSPLSSVHELVFFLLPGAARALPQDSGLLLYWQVAVGDRSSGFELLGSLVPSEKQSDVFRTGWSEREEFIDLNLRQPPPVVTIRFGISVEPIGVVRNLTTSSGMASGGATTNNYNNNTNNNNQASNDRRPLVAQKIAKNLYNFMLSFDTGGATGNQSMVVPANIFDRWWRRFEAKLKRDPNFFLKNDD